MRMRKLGKTLKIDDKESDLDDFEEAFHLVIRRFYLILVVLLRSIVSYSVNNRDGL